MIVLKRLFYKITNNDYIFSIVANLSGVIIGVLYSALYARYLGPDLKGTGAIIGNYISIGVIIVGLGMYQAYPFYKKTQDNLLPQFVNNMFTFCVICECLSICLAILLPIEITLRIAMVFIPVSVFIKSINYVVLIEHPRRRNLNMLVINSCEILVIIVFMVFTRASFLYLIVLLTCIEIIRLCFSFTNLHYSIRKLKFQFNHLCRYAKFGILPMFTLLMMTINYKVDILMLKQFDNVTLAEIGIYSVGVAFAEKLWLIPDSVKSILISKLVKGKDCEEVAKVIRINLMVTILSIIAVIILGKPFINLVFGLAFSNSYDITVILLIGIIGMIFYKMVYSYNIVNGHRVFNLLFLGSAAVVNIVGNYIFIPYGGIASAAWVSVISYNICGICFLVFFRIRTKIPYKQLLIINKDDINMLMFFFKKKF